MRPLRLTDIGTTREAIDLLGAIAATPDDGASQLVLADLLLSVDDPRGELIVLDRREAESPIVDPVALERYLLLAAEYSFPQPRPILVASFLPITRVVHVLRHDGHVSRVIYDRGRVQLYVGGDTEDMVWRVYLADRDSWTEAESTPILRAIADAIIADTPLRTLRVPFERDPLPTYAGGPIRGYPLPKEFTEPRDLSATRYGLAAQDYRRWIALWARLVTLESSAI